ncbi:hypothetical protein J437_LFUL010334 [Ladona fulva]|uniref:Uncharacterized protein n=1 Tax=Ladona fulva TaxID=123851 RepID=A0A8K0NZJ2_LADFU|nr:hypothetical protein J437_LFUL010334 [Ladona fulva]
MRSGYREPPDDFKLFSSRKTDGFILLESPSEHVVLDLRILTHTSENAPNDSGYMIGGVLIAMILVALIIVLLAVTISK